MLLKLPAASARKLKTHYLIALGTIALLMLISQVVIQGFLAEHDDAGSIINMVGQQRTLSQRITLLGELAANRAASTEELSRLTDEWVRVHAQLQANTFARQDAIVQRELKNIEPAFAAMVAASRCLSQEGDCEGDSAEILLAQNTIYLAGMEAIVDRYAAYMESDLRTLQRLEMVLFVIKIVALVSIGVLVLYPSARRIIESQQKLAVSERRYRLLAENATDMLTRYTAEGVYLYVSPVSLRLLGYLPDEMIGRSMFDFYHPEDVAAVSYVQRGLLDTQSALTTTYRLRRKDGAYIWFETTSQAIYDPETQAVTELTAISRDVTWRKQVEDALLRERDLMTLLMDNIPDTIYFKDKQSRFTRVNRAQAKTMRVAAPDQVIGKTDFDFQPRELAEMFLAEEQELLTTGEPITDRVEYNPTADGKPRWFSATKVPMRDSSGKIVGLVGISRDITERHEIAEALQESRRLIEHIADTVPDVLYVYDLIAQQNVYANRQVAPIMGYAVDEVQALGSQLFQTIVYPDDLPQLLQNQKMFQIIKDGEFVESEYRIQHKNGEVRWLYSRDTIFTRLPDGKPQRILGIAQDVTARKKAEEELREAIIGAQAANRAKTQFLASMSHELRTPLNAILGFAQLLSAEADAEKRGSLDVILQSGEHLLNLINNVLEMSRIEAGQMTLHEEAFDLHRLIVGVEEMLRGRARAKRLPLLVDGLDNLPVHVFGDAGKLRQVLINLLNNAIKFTEHGKVILRARVEPYTGTVILKAPTGSYPVQLIFEVEDSGSGIAPEEIELIFQPFRQTGTGQKVQEGSGLGLALSRELAQLMRGDLSVRSQPGEGSTFTLTVQMHQLSNRAKTTESSRRRAVALATGQPIYRILIAEDQVENRRLLCKIMKSVGLEVKEAQDGIEAIALYESWQPHLIWMDMQMPRLDGMDATRQIKNINPHVIIIALTASAFEHERAAILAAGCDDLITKPFRTQDLFDKLRIHLGAEFIYDEPETTPLPVLSKLTPETLAALPPDLHTALKQAVTVLDPQKSLRVIEKIEAHQPDTAALLSEWVRGFRFDKILALFH